MDLGLKSQHPKFWQNEAKKLNLFLEAVQASAWPTRACISGKFKQALPHIVDQIREPWFEDRNFAAIKRRRRFLSLSMQVTLVAEVGKAGHRRRPDICGADHGYGGARRNSSCPCGRSDANVF
jgi:hypothetical protein